MDTSYVKDFPNTTRAHPALLLGHFSTLKFLFEVFFIQ